MFLPDNLVSMKTIWWVWTKTLRPKWAALTFEASKTLTISGLSCLFSCKLQVAATANFLPFWQTKVRWSLRRLWTLKASLNLPTSSSCNYHYFHFRLTLPFPPSSRYWRKTTPAIFGRFVPGVVDQFHSIISSWLPTLICILFVLSPR